MKLVIDIPKEVYKCVMDGTYCGTLYEYLKNGVPVEPERKMGKWEYVQYDGNPKIGNWHCSECHLIVNLGFEYVPYYHYCPWCGVYMTGKERR